MVSFTDCDGIEHAVQVAATSMYEAAALAISEFRKHPWGDGIGPGRATRLTVRVETPATAHQFTVQQLEEWVARSPKSPREVIFKARLRELLNRKP